MYILFLLIKRISKRKVKNINMIKNTYINPNNMWHSEPFSFLSIVKLAISASPLKFHQVKIPRQAGLENDKMCFSIGSRFSLWKTNFINLNTSFFDLLFIYFFFDRLLFLVIPSFLNTLSLSNFSQAIPISNFYF